MKINKINTVFYSLLTAGTIIFTTPMNSQKINRLDKDIFEYSISPTGSNDSILLLDAPSPEVEIAGKKNTAIFVVDTKKNLLYKYNEIGKATNVYPVATGKPSTPTKTGIRKVTHVEKYPYSNAPLNCKRRKSPVTYGPRIIFLDKVDKDTGKTGYNDEFIHGTSDPSSIGKHASMGCVRMDNEVIKQLASEVKQGDIVLIQ